MAFGHLSKPVPMSEQGVKNNIDMVLQVSVSANEKIYEAILGGVIKLCVMH